jgi:hypothetical protein
MGAKHGGTGTRLYNAFINMMDRCYNGNNKDYHRYGGRGIVVSDTLKPFAIYRKWFKDTFNLNDIPEGLTLDRENNNRGYESDNMRLATVKQQNNNRSTNKRIEYNGETHTISEWSDKTGIPRKTLEKRLGKYGWPVERALTTPSKHHWNIIEYNGEKKTIRQWSKERGIPVSTIHYRLNKNLPMDEVLKLKPVGEYDPPSLHELL